MAARLAFHKYLKKWLIQAFGSEQFQPAEIAEKIVKLQRRPCERTEIQGLSELLSKQEIKRLVHFTELCNVPSIVRFGLIPRDYLQLEVLQLAIGARFSDSERYDSNPEFSCVSITSPNYRMFFKKRQSGQGTRWAVVEFDASLVKEYFFMFTPTNAGSGCAAWCGAKGLALMFAMRELRDELCLAPDEPTDPQAEALCDSVIPPAAIKNIYVECSRDLEWLSMRKIQAEVGRKWFEARRDYRYWRGKRISDLPGFPRALQSRAVL